MSPQLLKSTAPISPSTEMFKNCFTPPSTAITNDLNGILLRDSPAIVEPNESQMSFNDPGQQTLLKVPIHSSLISPEKESKPQRVKLDICKKSMLSKRSKKSSDTGGIKI